MELSENKIKFLFIINYCICYTLIISVFVSELVRDVDRDDEAESDIVVGGGFIEGIGWDIDECWSDGIFKEEESINVCWEISWSCCFRFGEIIGEDWRLVSWEISIYGPWSGIVICSLELSNIDESIMNKIK